MHQPQSATTPRPKLLLPVIIFSQFAGTSLWFASNAILPDLRNIGGMAGQSIGLITSAVMLGFIFGTLCFALFTIADRFTPRKIFFVCSLLGALFNISLIAVTGSLAGVLASRFLTGVCLAGIYPIGMKIASGWYRTGLGHAMGFLLGALVVGTAFPHLLRGLGAHLPWRDILISVSALAAFGGVLMLRFVQDGPYLVKGTRFNPKALKVIFHERKLREVAFGYFGHMWELYTFYAFLPPVLIAYFGYHNMPEEHHSVWTFAIIAAGAIGCAGGGLLSRRYGSARVALTQLSISGTLCLLSPLLFESPPWVFLPLVLLWGITVSGDSPQFSTMVATYAPRELVGSALAITTSIGFSISIVSIECISLLGPLVGMRYLFLLLTIGPVIGLIAAYPILSHD